VTKQSPQRSPGQAPQSHKKSLIIGSAIFRNEIATPFGLAMIFFNKVITLANFNRKYSKYFSHLDPLFLLRDESILFRCGFLRLATTSTAKSGFK
jgi:hypothetical protein